MSVRPDRRGHTLMRGAAAELLAGAVAPAVAHFSEALDGAGERYVRTLCLECGLGADLVEAAWAGMGAGQRAGALGVLFLLDTATPLGIDVVMTNLRDRVVHQARKFGHAKRLGPVAARQVLRARPPTTSESVRASRMRSQQQEAWQYCRYVYSLVAAIERALERHPLTEADPAVASHHDCSIDPAWTFEEFLLVVAGNRAAAPFNPDP